MPRCDHCPVSTEIECPGNGWHCRAVASRDPDRIAQLRSIAVGRAINRCPNRGLPACTCNAFATCLLGKGRRGQTDYADCVQCVNATPQDCRPG